jgi:hypothetical protein
MKRFGIQTHMPSCKPLVGDQMTVEEANLSRLVTKIRWIVEAYHARLKKFKFFDNRQPTSNISRFGPSLKIVSAAFNAFRDVYYDTQINVDYHLSLAHRMLERSKIPENPLEALVKTGTFSSRGRWEEIIQFVQDDEFPLESDQAKRMLQSFPRLSETQLEATITCGPYQLKQGIHYVNEHMDTRGGFQFYVHLTRSDLIRCRLQSRHSSSTKYFLWIQFEEANCKQIVISDLRNLLSSYPAYSAYFSVFVYYLLLPLSLLFSFFCIPLFLNKPSPPLHKKLFIHYFTRELERRKKYWKCSEQTQKIK